MLNKRLNREKVPIALETTISHDEWHLGEGDLKTVKVGVHRLRKTPNENIFYVSPRSACNFPYIICVAVYRVILQARQYGN